MTSELNFSHMMTLEPPGSITVVGAGPLGLEAALYGRFLGYNVRVLEAAKIGRSLEPLRDESLTLLPDQTLSSLAAAAIDAQVESNQPRTLPMTFGQWIDDGLRTLAETDLLRGRVQTGNRLIRVELIPAENDEDSEMTRATEDIPDDFQLHVETTQPQDATQEAVVRETVICEAVIVATGTGQLSFDSPGSDTEYWFRIGQDSTGDIAVDLREGYRQIVNVYAQLAGRENLDLYQPKRN